MKHGVLYVLTGTKLAARLVVALATLRKHFSGPVAIVSGDAEAAEICERIAKDQRLDAMHIPITPPQEITKHRGFVLKTLVHQFTPFETTLFIDCDTIVRGSLAELFSLPTPQHILVTQFCNWSTYRGPIRRRIKAWRDICPELIKPALRFGAAINTGVFSFTSQSQIFTKWFEIASLGQHHFIPDEVALQLLIPSFPHVLADQRFNCSPKYGTPLDPETRIVHFHGRKHVGQYGDLWIAAYNDAIEHNLANIQSWTPGTDVRLRAYLSNRKDRA